MPETRFRCQSEFLKKSAFSLEILFRYISTIWPVYRKFFVIFLTKYLVVPIFCYNFPFLTVDIAYSKIHSELDSLKMCYLTRHMVF